MYTNVYTFLHIKMDKDDQKAPVSARIPISLFANLYTELKYTGQNRSEFIQEAIEEKLTNSDKELMLAEIKYMEKKIEILKNKVEKFKEKKEDMNKLTEEEREFLKESAELLGKDPTFVKGRISLYKNLFNKHYPISESEFWDLLNKTE